MGFFKRDGKYYVPVIVLCSYVLCASLYTQIHIYINIYINTPVE